MSIPLPFHFQTSIQSQIGENEANLLFKSLEEDAPISIRINTEKYLAEYEEKVKWCTNSAYLSERPSFSRDPLWHAGAYYVQEASSMFLEYLWKKVFDTPEDKLRVLDLCASPGGKSTLLSSLLSENDLLVCNEVIKTRIPPLVDNLSRWGKAHYVVTNHEAKDFNKLPSFFDALVVDAPCSGEGMFRKDPNARKEWSTDHVKLCSLRQTKILEEILPSLRDGGILFYSTCTFNQEEDEQQVQQLIDQGYELLQFEIDSSWGIDTGTGYKFFPHKTKGEGFYIACLRKPGEEKALQIPKSKADFVPPKQKAFLKDWFTPTFEYDVIKEGEELYALPIKHLHDILFMQRKMKIFKKGIHLGKSMKDSLIPSHELALSLHLANTIQKVELDEEESLNYLKREAISPEGFQQGWTIVTYKNLALGWAKSAGNRVNNYYPKEIRLLK